jgi:glycosyltransferase involved in cell wall biosynthesis
MHLLYLIDSLVPGGAERSLAALAPRYIGRGIELDVAYFLERPGLHDQLREAGARLYSLDGGGGRLGRIGRVRSLIQARRPDLVHTTLFEADVTGRVAARLSGARSVTSLVSVPYGAGHRGQPGIQPWKVRAAQAVDAVTARLATRFHAISHLVADLMSARLRIPRHRIDVIPRGLDPDELGAPSPERKARVRDVLSVGPEDPLVVVTARHDYPKGLDVLVEAFARVRQQVPRATLAIAGRSGGLTPLLHDLTSRHRLGEAVRFLGPRRDVPDLLCAADVSVIPSRWEGFGVALIEAMAMGARIVATDLPTTREITADGACARLVPVGQPGALAEAIVEALHDPEAERRAAAARGRFLSQYTIDRVENGMMAFYQRALGALPNHG